MRERGKEGWHHDAAACAATTSQNNDQSGRWCTARRPGRRPSGVRSVKDEQMTWVGNAATCKRARRPRISRRANDSSQCLNSARRAQSATVTVRVAAASWTVVVTVPGIATSSSTPVPVPRALIHRRRRRWGRRRSQGASHGGCGRVSREG